MFKFMKMRFDYVKFLNLQNNDEQILNIKTNKKNVTPTNDLFTVANKINFRYKNTIAILKSYNYNNERMIDAVELWVQIFNNLTNNFTDTGNSLFSFITNCNFINNENLNSFSKFNFENYLFKPLQYSIDVCKNFNNFQISLGFTYSKITFEYTIHINPNIQFHVDFSKMNNHQIFNGLDFQESISITRYGTKFFDKPVILWDSQFLRISLHAFLEILLANFKYEFKNKIKDDFSLFKELLDTLESYHSLKILPVLKISEFQQETYHRKFSFKNILRVLIEHYNLKSFIPSINPRTYLNILKNIYKIVKNFSEKSIFDNDLDNLLCNEIERMKIQTIKTRKPEFKTIIEKFLEKGWDLKKITTFILFFLRKIDPNVHKVFLDLTKTNDNSYSSIINIQYQGGKMLVPLPSEWNSLVTLLLIFKYNKLFWSDQQYKYIFVREFGFKRHPNFIIDFLEFFFNSGLNQQRTLIFSSNNPKLADFLPSDCIYFLDNNEQLIRLSDVKNVKNSKFTNHYLKETENFSKISSKSKFTKFTDIFEDDVLKKFQEYY